MSSPQQKPFNGLLCASSQTLCSLSLIEMNKPFYACNIEIGKYLTLFELLHFASSTFTEHGSMNYHGICYSVLESLKVHFHLNRSIL